MNPGYVARKAFMLGVLFGYYPHQHCYCLGMTLALAKEFSNAQT